MKEVNILYITVRSDIGGGPIHVTDQINKLDTNKYKLFLACPSSGSIYESKWKRNNRIRQIILIPHRKFKILSFINVVRFVKANKIQIVHSHGKGAGLYSRLLKLFFKKIKVVHTFHGINITEKGVLKKIKNVYIERILKKYTDAFICVSNGEQQLAISNLKIKKPKIKLIYNGVEDKLDSYKQVVEQKTVVSFSRFSYEKNMQASYEIAKRSKSDVIFKWIGDGDDFGFIEKKKKIDKLDNIELMGFQNNPCKYLLSGSLYLSTSRHEGLPLSLLEALSRGIPIIATNVVGNNEVVINGYNGYLFEQNDIDYAVKKIEDLFNDLTRYKTLSENARKDYLERFTIHRMVTSTEKVYDELLF